MKPKLSPVGQPQQIIEKEYKKPILEEIENREYTEGARKALEKEIIKRKKLEDKEQKECSVPIEAITAENIGSEATALKEENEEVAESIISRNSTRLKITKTLKVEGRYLNYDSITEDVKIKTGFCTSILKKSELDSLLAELQELKEVLKEGENHN